MSDPKLISPLLDGFAMGEPISEHDGVRCCPAIDENTGEKYIVKIISIPASPVKLEALLLSGAYPDQQAAVAYFRDLADGVVEEAKALRQLSQLEGFLPYAGWQIRPMDDQDGYDIYLLGAYRHSLSRAFRRESMTHLRAVNLGLDLCAALTVCRRAGYLLVDLKPENVFLTEQNEFRIGDLGFVRLSSLKYASLPERYRSAYTAPEITDAFSSLNETMDIYAAGLILYQAYNNGTLPFEGEKAPQEALPPPEYADYEMAEIILKACAPEPEDRWQDPTQLGQALVTYMQRNGANDTPIVPQSIPPVNAGQTEPLPAEDIPEQASDPEDTQGEPVAQIKDPEEEPELTEEDAREQEDAPQTEDTPADADTQEPGPEADELTDSEDENAGASAAQAEDGTEPDTEKAEPDTEEVEEPDKSAEAAEADDTAEDIGSLKFLDDMEQSDADPEEISYQEVTDEVSDILTQVDDIVAHPVPDPVVAPEPIEVPMPEPILLQEPEEDAPEEEPEEAAEEEPEAPEDTDLTAIPQEDTVNSYSEAEDIQEPRKKKKFRGLVAILITLIMLVIALTLGYLFYKNYYLQNIDDIRVEGENSTLSVYVDSQANSDLLFVTCADDYGNRYTSYIADGKAIFQNLSPNTHYTVKVQINGFHALTGTVSATYNTPPQTNILQFSAVTGPENGSVLLSFTAEAPTSPEETRWKILYSAADEEEKSVTCTGTSATLTGLTVGKEYTIRLVPEASDFVTGNDTITFTAKNLVYAENLRIVSCADGKLTAKWDENPSVAAWKVHCYLADGTYVETKTVTESTVIFENIDVTQGYVVEVLAEGMSVSERTGIDKDSVTVQNFQADVSVPGQITLTWDASSAADSWTVTYSIAGYDREMSAKTKEQKLVLDSVPGETYHFLITRDDGNVLCEALTAETPEALPFSRNKGSSPITAGDITFEMCRTPDIKDWNRHDLKKSDYTTRFTAGENASFVLRMMKVYDVSNDKVTVTFVSRSEDGSVVAADSEEMVWSSMWKMYYGFFDVPSIPTAPGNYVVSMYIDGGEVLRQAYTVE